MWAKLGEWAVKAGFSWLFPLVEKFFTWMYSAILEKIRRGAAHEKHKKDSAAAKKAVQEAVTEQEARDAARKNAGDTTTRK